MNTTHKFYAEIIELFYTLDQNKENFLNTQSESDLKNILDLDDRSRQWNASFEDVKYYLEKYIKYGVKTDHPQFLNRMWTGANPASIAWEIVAALQQTSACTFESAPVSTLMEKYMISQMLEIVGFENGEGQMTTWSSNANMIAMMSARNLHNSQAKKSGLFAGQEMFAFVNQESHYSFDKAANILWIWLDHLIKVPVNTAGEMDISELEKLLEEYSKIWKTFFVAATAGTTVRWAYDNIQELIKLREKYHFWLHVDGAWGGPVFLSKKLRKIYLSGLEWVDSFTFDFHKIPWVALICNMLLINEKKWILEHNCLSGNTDYIFKWEDDQDHEQGDLWVKSLQCGRRVDSLKLFLDWKYYGQEWFAQKIEKYLALCEYAQEYIEKYDTLEMSFERPSFNVCFTYKLSSREESNKINALIRSQLYERGLSLVWSATIENIFFLRLLICNDSIEHADIDMFFENVVNLWNELTKNKE